MGTPIHAAASGTVVFAAMKGAYGNLIVIQHDESVETYYAHCSAIYVKVGDEVTINDTISAVGSTGNSTGLHLHFEVRINGRCVNPLPYLQ